MLSRPPCDEEIHAIEENCICAFQIDMPSKSLSEIREEQLKDQYLMDVITSLEQKDENSLKWINPNYLINILRSSYTLLREGILVLCIRL